MQKHILSFLVENKPGVLQRVTGLFTRRGFNIDTITVGSSEREGLARMTVISHGDEKVIEQVVKQLNKLVQVITVRELDYNESVLRELCLIKVKINDDAERSEIIQYTNIYRAKIIDVATNSLGIEVTGDPEKVDSFINLLSDFSIIKIVRTGVTAMSRGLN